MRVSVSNANSAPTFHGCSLVPGLGEAPGGSGGTSPSARRIPTARRSGSVATVVYCGTGAPSLGKERVELFGGGQAVVLDDFRTLEFHGVPGRRSQRGRTVQKGYLEILQNFHDAIRGTASLGVTARDGYWATWCAEQALRAMTGAPVHG